MRQLRSLLAVAVVLASSLFAAAPAGAQPRVLIDFAEFRSDTAAEYQATPGGQVSSKGFDFYAAFGSGARNALGTWGTAPDQDFTASNLPTNLGSHAAALFGTQFGERMDMVTTQPGQLFQLFSMDVSHLYARSYLLSGDLQPISLYFYGFNASGVNSVVTAFTIPVPPLVGGDRPPLLTRLIFSSAWSGLSQVAWFQGSGAYSGASGTVATLGSAYSHQFTNISAQIAPEPSTYLLLAVGLSGVLVIARRRRA